jgi:GGDEF domain-containing protein
MAPDYLDQRLRVLTPEVFQLVLNNELKRALRSQNYLTLLVLDFTSLTGAVERGQLTREVARVVDREVRETDLLSETVDGRLSVVLLDADLQNAMRVVDRLAAHFQHYVFSTPTAITAGAACYPTHGSDPESLRRAAEANRVYPRGGLVRLHSNEH